ncbi:ribbon-helix-helix CopG family protein [Stackebrandtia albiflava]|uniref:Ribbon-helix-helix CopG family protein n=1 Tax=Stackebrandtia albiflava TaxID=406432 RepID=A0A562UY95_9ACTN|nr:ribbon-helix-helix protein, CopG family [Stackebrandtia albiflava]TWJ10576.1 ribbon-helix-helix CopG family protein [Stackebrandtia albiflava]
MKTAISMPDEVFRKVQECADELGVSRSEFITSAAERYVAYVRNHTLTHRLNAALAFSVPDEITEEVVSAGKRRLADEDEDW